MSILDSTSKFLLRFRQGTGSARPPLEPFYIYFLAIFVGYVVADLSVIQFRPSMLPSEAPPVRPTKMSRESTKLLTDYASITDRNIFSADGKIPPALSSGEQDRGAPGGPAVPSSLPIKLLGTIVHANPGRSIASVNITSMNKTASFKVNEEIEGLARVTKIERRKLTFRNLNNNRMEYVEIPDDALISFDVKDKDKSAQGDIVRRGEFDFAVKRSDLEMYTSDMTAILRQARMVPNIVPGSGGQVDGFRFVTIEPGSVYEKLGFKPGDIIKNVNGEPVTSPTKAMELYNMLKNESAVALGVERNGRMEDFRYTIE